MTKVSIFMANGTEECEALLVVDILRRAEIQIDTVSIEEDKTILSAHDVRITCDKSLDEFTLEGHELLVLPGGLGGTNRMKENKKLEEIFRKFHEQKQNIAAVCAAPTVLAAYGLFDGHKATVYPGMDDQLTNAEYQDETVIQDKNLITARGLGASIPFALKLVEILRDKETADKVAKAFVYY